MPSASSTWHGPVPRLGFHVCMASRELRFERQYWAAGGRGSSSPYLEVYMNEEKFLLFVGVDLASVANHQVCVLDSNGGESTECKVGHSGIELSAFFARIEAFGYDPSQVVIGVESPGDPLVDGAMDRGFRVFHANPKKIDRFRERESAAGAKDDRRDARVIARALQTDLHCFQQVDAGDPLIASLRELIRERTTLLEQRGALANRLRDQLQRYYPAALELCGAANERWFWRVIALAPTPNDAKDLGPGSVSEILKELRVRKVTPNGVVQKLRERAPWVRHSIVTACSSRVQRLIRQIKPVNVMISEVEGEIQTLLRELAGCQPEESEKPCPEGRHRDAEILLSMPGVGTIVGATVLAEAATALQDRNYQRFRTLAGLAPVTKASGKRKHGTKYARVSMRYACSGPLRNAIHHMASIAVRHDPAATAHYERLRTNGASYGRALRGVADRLARILFAALRSHSLYDPTRLTVVYAKAT